MTRPREDEDAFADLKRRLVKSARRQPGIDHANATEDDIYIEGALSVIYEFCLDWRSEIEELG